MSYKITRQLNVISIISGKIFREHVQYRATCVVGRTYVIRADLLGACSIFIMNKEAQSIILRITTEDRLPGMSGT
jgi:hypothetical protein